MRYKLLVLDIDGTATNSKKEVTPATRDAVVRLQEAGVLVAIASGRPVPGVAPVADAFSFGNYGSYILAYNGGRILNWKTKECVYKKALPASLAKRLYEDAVRYNTGIMTYTEDDTRILCGRQSDSYIELESRICSMPVILCKDDFIHHMNFDPIKCILTGEPEEMECLEPIIAQKYQNEATVFRSEPFYLEVMPKNIDKAYCLSKLLKILGLGREEMICCGDSYNDVTMLQYAGMGIAMENARPGVKDVADFVTLSNDEDGVAYAIRKFWPELFI